MTNGASWHQASPVPYYSMVVPMFNEQDSVQELYEGLTRNPGRAAARPRPGASRCAYNWPLGTGPGVGWGYEDYFY